ncbi:MAG: T9SS type A sorting domain-containing protein [Bacteroidia bacterium]
MKKTIYISILFICISFYSKAQFNVFDSALVITAKGTYSYNLSGTSPTAPTGPDYGNLLTTKNPKWIRWTVCGSEQVNYTLFNSINPTMDTVCVAIWGPFSDTTNIFSSLNASHLNQYYNFPLNGSANFTLPFADSVGIYLMLITTNKQNGSIIFGFDDMGSNISPILHFDSRCGICSGRIVNYEQPLCAITYDTAYKKYCVLWDKQNNYGIASFNVYKYVNAISDSIGNVPVSASGSFIDPNYEPTTNTFGYRIKAIDSCDNSATNLSYGFGAPNAYGQTPVAGNSGLYFYFPSTFQPLSNKVFIYRGPNETNMILRDSIQPITSSGYYNDQNPPQGLCYYSFVRIISGGCHPDNSTTISEVRTSSALIQHICLVAYDTTLQKNIVIWDKQDNSDIDHFNIYREGSVLNQYDSIGWVNESAPAMFVDMGVNPNTKLYKYLVKPVDANGNVLTNVYSGSHTTIHMQASAGLFGEVNLSWNPYEGFGYTSYYIYRGTTSGNLQVIDSIASNSVLYTDYTAPPGLNFYRVTVRNPYGCHPDSSTVVYEARSNSSYAVVTGINDALAQQLKLYPNPANDFATLDYTALPYITHFDIVNSLGNTVQSLTGNIQNKITINTSKLNKGVYYVTAKTKKGVLRKKLVVY